MSRGGFGRVSGPVGTLDSELADFGTSLAQGPVFVGFADAADSGLFGPFDPVGLAAVGSEDFDFVALGSETADPVSYVL